MSREDIISIIKAIWSEEVSANTFSLADDFFELGGNSLKLISVLDKLQKQPTLQGMSEVSVIDLFDHPVLADLATLIESRHVRV